MSSDEPGTERQEVPLGSRRFEHFRRIDTNFVKEQRKFIHQRDIEVPLSVLDDLGGLRNADTARSINACDNNAFVDSRDALEGLRAVSRLYLGDSRQRVLAVAGINPLRRIADEKIALPLLP